MRIAGVFGCCVTLLAGCVEMDFGERRLASSVHPSRLEVESFQKQYPELSDRAEQAFKRTLHPLLMKSCGGCHSLSGPKADIPHSDGNLSISFGMASELGLFNLQTPEDSRVFHLDVTHSGLVNIAALPDSPAGPKASVWRSKIESYAALRGALEVSEPLRINCGTYSRFNPGASPVDVLAPGRSFSIARQVENASSYSNVDLSMRLKVAFGASRELVLSGFSLLSNVQASQLLRIEKIKFSLTGSVNPDVEVLTGPFEVRFDGSSEAGSLGATSVTLSSAFEFTTARCNSAGPYAGDGVTFEFVGMRWVPAPSPSPSPSASPSGTPAIDYRPTRKDAAMQVIRSRCLSCHGLGEGTGPVFPKATQIASGNFSQIADSDWINVLIPGKSVAWAVPGQPQNSGLIRRLKPVPGGGPAYLQEPNSVGFVLSLQEIWALNDWIQLMSQADQRTLRFEIPTGNSVSLTGDWNSATQPIRLKRGDKLFVRNLDAAEHAIHTNSNRPFPHQVGNTGACGMSTPCGSSVFTTINPANSLPMQGSDAIYDHLFRDTLNSMGQQRKFNIYMVVDP